MNRSYNKKLETEIKKSAIKLLFSEIEKIHSTNDLEFFLTKFMTSAEQNAFIRRFAVLTFIKSGKKYIEIKEFLNISDNTISNIMDILKGRGYGKNPKRKKVYSSAKDLRKRSKRSLLGRYKGAESII